MTTYYTYCESPLERLMLTSDGTSLTGLYMVEHKHGPQKDPGWVRNDAIAPFDEAKCQLMAYFGGTLKGFEVPTSLAGTEFQRKVWGELCRIPFGETISYGELARRLGNPNASRAVGLANGRNPISIIVPCHRVVGAGGNLTGYGGGLGRKGKLLAWEKAVLSEGHRD
jgi:methylated-DNA-[protein]-cysteine S-methyltransferase